MPNAIPHSVFKSWPETDQLKALAWNRRIAEHCPRCHQHPDDWQADGRPLSPPERMYESSTCYSCMEREAFVQQHFGAPDKRTDDQKERLATARVKVVPYDAEAIADPTGRRRAERR